MKISLLKVIRNGEIKIKPMYQKQILSIYKVLYIASTLCVVSVLVIETY